MIAAYVIVLIAGFMTMFFVATTPESRPKKEYVEYSTATVIDKKWHDLTLVGECGHCGWDDSPIVHHHWSDHTPKCKWCAELDNLNYHLREHGSR